MKNYVTIVLNKEEYQTLLKINERYYFDLFKTIRKNEEEEFILRDSLSAITKKIKESLWKQMKTDGILCKIEQDEIGMWKVTAEQDEKKITLALKETKHDAKELAFALHSLGKVGAVEIGGLLILWSILSSKKYQETITVLCI